MRVNVMPEIKSCSVAARVVAYLLSLVPIGYLAVAVSFIAIAIEQFDHRYVTISQSEIRIPFWILSVFSAAFCVYAAKVTWSFFTEFRDLKTSYVFRRALKKCQKEMKLDKTPNFDDYFRSLGEEPKPRKSILQKVNDLLPW